jgi:tetratricopeptide (TPR) repeat protein
MRRGTRLLHLAAASLALGGMAAFTAAASERISGTVVRDLYYGEVLFQFYKEDDFAALTHLMAAEQAGRIPHHEAEAELLLGGLYLSYGQHDRAAQIFERLLAANSDPETRDRAWFYLGKLRFQRALYAEALASFAKVGSKLPEALAAEMPMLVAECHMAQGHFDEAAAQLAKWKSPGEWSNFTRYNLGVSLVRTNRFAEGAALLDAVGQKGAASPEAKSLRDKANLALGYAYLQASDGAHARPVLERIRLRGPFSTKALLGVGWADALAQDYRAALVPWSELADRDLLDSAVQESFLAVPYALGKLNASGEAVERYKTALGSFDTEIGHIDEAIVRARTGELIPAMLTSDDRELGRWYWQLKKLPDLVESRYLYHLMADHAFQEGLKNFRDLRTLAAYLDDWRQKIDVFNDMVSTRSQAFEQRRPATDARLESLDVAGIRARRDAAASQLQLAEQSRDVTLMADAKERDEWQRLVALEAAPRWSAPENAEARERQRFLKGFLLWSLDRDYKLRLWRAQRSLRQLDRTLGELESRVAHIREARAKEPGRLTAMSGRIAELGPRISAMQTAVNGALQEQENGLAALAVAELQAQKQRLSSYRIQARFALANLYDQAASSPVRRSGVTPAEGPRP